MCWGDRARVKEIEAEKKHLLAVLAEIRFSMLARIHDDGQARELYDTELDLIESQLEPLDTKPRPVR